MPSIAQQSLTHWNNFQVDHFGPDVTVQESLEALDDRNSAYPGLLALMPVDLPGLTIMDFGCGPGHDTIGFLAHGANHVYAVDTSLRGLTSLWHRLKAHGYQDRCTIIHIGHKPTGLPVVPYIHCAGVVHHVPEPIRTLTTLKQSLDADGEIRMMVYAAESQFVKHHGGPHGFERIADGKAPIARAWSKRQIREIAHAAGLKATYLGGYLCHETSGPGLGGCWTLKPEGETMATITLDNPDPSFGDTVTFTVDTKEEFPWVHCQCLQNNDVVYDQWVGMFATYTGPTYFKLGPTQAWTSGAANGIATLNRMDRHGSPRTLAKTTFKVSGE